LLQSGEVALQLLSLYVFPGFPFTFATIALLAVALASTSTVGAATNTGPGSCGLNCIKVSAAAEIGIGS